MDAICFFLFICWIAFSKFDTHDDNLFGIE